MKLSKGVLENVLVTDMGVEGGRGCVGECCASCNGVKLSKGVLKNVLVADME